MSLLADILIAAASIGANALVFAFILGKRVQKFEDHIASILKDLAAHGTRLDANDSRFDRHGGKIVRLTVAGAQVATALAVKMNNPHPDPIFQKLAESYERIHGSNLADTPT